MEAFAQSAAGGFIVVVIAIVLVAWYKNGIG
jgi:hypothetical protein